MGQKTILYNLKILFMQETDMQRHTKQLFINISNLVRGDDRTGVPRVARGLLSSLLETPPDDIESTLSMPQWNNKVFFMQLTI